jgi:hypothetical protein
VIRGLRWSVATLLIVLALPPTPARGQDSEGLPPMELRVDTASGALSIRLGAFLQSPGLENALQSGLPLRVQITVELWRDRFFDSQQGQSEWRASVLYEPLGRSYEVRTATAAGGRELDSRSVSSLSAARLELQRSLSVPLRPESEGTYYYTAVLEVETLSLSDIEELQRWLQGELAPAVSGDGDVGSAMGRGVRRLMIRMLGLPTRRFSERTRPFPFDPTVVGTGGESDPEVGPPDGQRLDPSQIRLDPDPDAVGDGEAPLDQHELRVHHVPIPIAPALRKISR